MDKVEKKLAIVFTSVGGFILFLLFFLLGRGNNNFLMIVIFFSLGIIFLTLGLLITFYTFNRELRTKKLLSHGKKLIIDSDSITVKKLNQSNSLLFVINLKYSDTIYNKTILFSSKTIPYNPKEFIKEITVYVDKKDYTNYHVDISFLPEAIEC